MVRITYTSVLPREFRPALESLLFFNPAQPRLRETIAAVIQEHGVPRIMLERGRLRVRLEGGHEVQTLFALAQEDLHTRLAGVAVYTRLETATILLLHLAVREEYSGRGAQAGTMLVLRFLAQLRNIAARIHGVRVLRVRYGSGAGRDIAVSGAGHLST